ncbi:MAG: hypothetical protein ACHQJ6_07880 [Candidatus Berkiellales bacterium]
MASLILHPTSIAQWHALLNEAQQCSSIYLKEDIESYLVFLLMRFTEEPNVVSSILGLDFLKICQPNSLIHQQQQLKEVGDKCLLFAGLFPGRAARRRVKLSYYVKLGQTAYSTLSSNLISQEELFNRLCNQFPKLTDVLHAMRETSPSAQNLLQTLEWWHETHSPVAWNKLCKGTKSLPSPFNFKKH